MPLVSITIANDSTGGLDVILWASCAVSCVVHCGFLIMQPLLVREVICFIQFLLNSALNYILVTLKIV